MKCRSSNVARSYRQLLIISPINATFKRNQSATAEPPSHSDNRLYITNVTMNKSINFNWTLNLHSAISWTFSYRAELSFSSWTSRLNWFLATEPDRFIRTRTTFCPLNSWVKGSGPWALITNEVDRVQKLSRGTVSAWMFVGFINE